DRQFYLQSYVGGPFTVDRMGRGTLFVPDVLVNLVGGIQPEKAGEVFGDGPEDGFAARFVTVWPERVYGAGEERYPDRAARGALDAVSGRLSSADWSALLLLDDFKPTPYCRPDPEGLDLFARWRAELMGQLQAGDHDGRLGHRVGKYFGPTARLTLVFHLVEWAAGRAEDPRVPSAATVAGVLDLVDDYVLPMDRRVYAQYGTSPAAAGGRRI